MPRLQGIVDPADARRLVDLQSHAMARPMKKSLHPLIDHAGLVPFLLEEIVDGCMDGLPGGPNFHHPESQLLPPQDRVIDPSQCMQAFSLDDCTRYVSLVSRPRGFGKHTHYYRIM